MKTFKRITALFFAVLLLASITFSAFAEEKEEEAETIEIRSLEDFLEFASGCTLDSYSRGKTFVLKTNISLADTDFKPIQDFYGTFEGNSHSIKNLDVSNEGSRQGLFRRIGETGCVRNLSVSGSVTPSGTATIVGGIVGENRGRLSGCSFSGTVKGINTVGGVAGQNMPRGIITDCRFSGDAVSEKECGGIAGYNSGIITSCRNNGSICTVPIDTESDMDFDLATFDVSQLTTDNFINLSNFGGITGINTGTLANCTNAGKVGYTYQGFNIGGISGKSAGYISACTNTAEVLGQRDVGGIAGQLVPYVEMEITKDMLEDIENQMGALNNAVNMTTASFNSMVDADVNKAVEMVGYAQAIGEEAVKIYNETDWDVPDIGDLPSLPDNPVVNTPDMTVINQNLNNLSQSATEMASLVGNTAETLSTGLQYIMLQVEGIIGVLNSAADSMRNRTDFTEDVSVRDAYELNTGAISKCINKGSVTADSNVGGIAGVSAVELDHDVADRLNVSDYFLSDAKTTFFAIIRDCENSSSVSARDSYAGGISGSMTIGAIMNCTGSGTVSTENGDYAGGIAGVSKGTVQGCSAHVNLNGNKYIGGISGYGCNINSCLSYILVDEGSEYLGSIAGYITGDSKENLYVDNGLGALDGASYSGSGEPISYDEMTKLEKVPSSFLPIRISFVANGKTVKTYDVAFGGSISKLPSVPDNEKGQYWKWNEFQRDNIFTGFTVTGKYYSRTPTLASEGEEPVFLVEGSFDEGQCLTVDEFTPDLSSIGCNEDDVIRSASLSVSGYEEGLTVHMKAEPDGTLYISDENGRLNPTSYKVDGSYIVFNMDNGASLVYVNGSPLPFSGDTIYYIAGAAALLIVGLTVILIVKKRKKAKGEKADEDQAEYTEDNQAESTNDNQAENTDDNQIEI